MGAVVGQTGPDDFSSSADAAKAYFACINENGGINGRPIEYLVEDDQWNPEVAGQVATKLVKDKKVVALVASASFVEMGVNAKLYSDEGVMSMASACAVSECFESPNIVSTNEGPLPSTIGAAQWAVANLGTKNVVCIGLTIPTVGQYSCGWTEKYMQAKGLTGSSVLLDPGAADLHAQRVAVAVDDQARQAVGLAMHQAQCIAVDRQACAHRHCGGDAALEEGGVDALGFVEAPGPGADFRGRAESGPGQELAAMGFHPHGFAAVGAAASHAALEHPGMAAQQGAFLAVAQDDLFHGQGLAFAGAGVRGVVHLRQVLEIQLGIDLRRADIGVAQQLLHRTQVAAALQQVAGK